MRGKEMEVELQRAKVLGRFPFVCKEQASLKEVLGGITLNQLCPELNIGPCRRIVSPMCRLLCSPHSCHLLLEELGVGSLLGSWLLLECGCTWGGVVLRTEWQVG